MKFGLPSLFCTLTFVAVLLAFVLTIGEQSILYLTPVALFAIGFIVGRRVQLPATGALLSISILLLYFCTFPHVLNYVKSSKIITPQNYWIWGSYEWFLLYSTYEVG